VEASVNHRWWTLAGLLVLPACPRSDVGAPCNHGGFDAPQEPVITFPALACDELMCVYAESVEIPPDPCAADADCNVDGSDRFICASEHCELALDHVLTRSMCSRPCSSDADCEDATEDNACSTGFTCTPLLQLGEWCCEKVCACRDDLATAALEELARDCAAGDTPGCPPP
jgi:hypothetical protein